jgi:hypothetical protein
VPGLRVLIDEFLSGASVMRLNIMRIIVVSVGLLLLSNALSAHHSTNDYDSGAIHELEGKLVKTHWRNPHVIFTVQAEGQNGEVQEWELATGAVYVLERSGLTEGMIPVGEQVRVAGWPSKSRPTAMALTNMLLPSGNEFVFRGAKGSRWSNEYSGGQWTSKAVTTSRRDIFRVWSVESMEVFVQFGGGIDVQLTEEARERASNFLEQDPCVPQGMPAIMVNPLPVEMVDQGGYISLQLAGFAVLRQIDMTPDQGVELIPATKYGYSSGRWVGETLEVQTTRVSWPYFDDAGTPQTENVEILETFSLGADGTRLEYTMTVTDPSSFVEPVTLNWYWIDIGEPMFLADMCSDDGR